MTHSDPANALHGSVRMCERTKFIFLTHLEGIDVRRRNRRYAAKLTRIRLEVICH